MQHIESAERHVIGACLVGGRIAVDEIHDLDLRARDFSTTARQATWQAILTLQEKGSEISTLSVVDALELSKNLDAAGGAAAISSLEAAGLGAGIRESATIVLEHAALRRIAEAASIIARSAVERDGDSASILQRAQEIFFRLGRRTARVIYADRPAIVQRLITAAAEGDRQRGIPTGWRSLDDDLLRRGLCSGQLVIIAARPSMGKSAFVQQLASSIADRHGAVALFSLEMGDEELVGRELVQASKIEQGKWRNALHGAALTRAQATVAERPLYLYDCPGATYSFIASTLRRAVQHQGIVAAAVDYLQLMRSESTKREQTKADAIGEITGSLKNLARELRIPIVLLSQLNRSVEQRPDKRPMMSDLRDSGTIEQDADSVLFLYRPEYYLREKTPPEQQGVCEIIVAKNRGGPTGIAALTWDGTTMRFSDGGTYDRR